MQMLTHVVRCFFVEFCSYADENLSVLGAFAMFGPGQFQSLYKHVTIPAAHALHFAGEATSVHHAWVEGALSSAFRSVAEIVSFIPV